MKIVSWHILKVGQCRTPEFLTIRGGSLCNANFPALVGLIIHETIGAILFDTGYDAEFFKATEDFPEKLYRFATPVQYEEKHSIKNGLSKYGLRNEDIKAIIVSHFHGDHVAGLKNFPNAKIFCSHQGFAQTQNGNRISRTMHGILSRTIPIDLPKRAQFYEEFEKHKLSNQFHPFEYGVDLLGDKSLLAVELKGHCIGHWGLIIQNDDVPVFLIGDAVWSIKSLEELRPPPYLVMKKLGDPRQYKKTLSDLHSLNNVAKGRLHIIPSHCQTMALKWVADSDE